MTRAQVIKLVREERNKQDKKWGAGRNLEPLLWNAILTEEVGEVSNAILEGKVYNAGEMSIDLQKELIQVASVVFAWLEGLTEDTWGGF